MSEPDDRGTLPVPRSGPDQGGDRAPGGEPGQARRGHRWLALAISVILAVLAVAHVVWLVTLVVVQDDTEHLETTLAAVIAGQLVDGPSTIYGPYTPTNPRVLIQAPLYYRLAGLLAWPLAARGLGPLPAAFITGRAISLASFLGLLFAVFRLAGLDGGSRRAGAWAAALVLSTWLFGTYPVTVRPDILGVLLQTLGTYLVLRVVVGDARPGWNLSWAYAAYALAACVKQHDVGSAAVSTAVLMLAWVGRRELRRPFERALLVGLLIVVSYYLAEEAVTRGWLSEALFRVPAALRSQVPPGDYWVIFGQVFTMAQRAAMLPGLALGCLIAAPGAFFNGRLNRLLWAYVAMEFVLIALLSYRNEGAWVNYGLQAAIYVCLLIGRAMARVVELPVRRWRVVPLGVIAAFVAYANLAEGYGLAKERAFRERLLNALVREPALAPWDPARVYFVGLPGYNRLCGRAAWIHDEWLYGKFERLRAVPLRSQWLRAGLTDGTIRLVILPRNPNIPGMQLQLDPPVPPGLHESLPELGYDFVMRMDDLGVWERRRSALAPSAHGRSGPR